MTFDRAKGPHRGEHNKQKACWCGGHNAKNAKKSKRHHSTRKRLEYREGRQGAALRHVYVQSEADRELNESVRRIANAGMV